MKEHTYDPSTLEAEQEKSLNQAQPPLYGTVKWGRGGGWREKERKEKSQQGKKTGRRKKEWVRKCSQAVRGNE